MRKSLCIKRVNSNIAKLTCLLIVLFALPGLLSAQQMKQIGKFASGQPRAIATQGTYLYIAATTGLSVVNTTLASITPQGLQNTFLATTSDALDVAVAGHYAYLAVDDGGLEVIDIASPLQPQSVGVYPTIGGARAIAISGQHVFLACTGAEILVFSISNPLSPSLVGSYTTGLSEPTGLSVSGNYLYVADGNAGLKILNIQTPAHPVAIGSYDSSGFATGVTISGSLAYLADGSAGLEIVNVATPSNVTHVGSYDSPGNTRQVTIVNNLALLADGTGGLSVVDISVPATPSLVAQNNIVGEAISSIVANEMNFLIGDIAGLAVVDLTVPSNPDIAEVVISPASARAIAIDSHYAYIANDAAGLWALDIADPALPLIVGGKTNIGTALGVAISSGLAYVAANDSGLKILNISDPANISSVGTYTSAGEVRSVAIQGIYAYLASGAAGLEIVDVSTPASPVSVGSYDTPATAQGITLSGNYAYIADGTNGLLIIDVSTPSAPTLVGSYDSLGTTTSVTIVNHYAYLADGVAGLLVLDITNPSSPQLATTLNTPGSALGIAISGDLAFIADGNSGLKVANITNPLTPSFVGDFDTPGSTSALVLSGNHAFIADYGYGLVVVDGRFHSISGKTNRGTKPLSSVTISAGMLGNVISNSTGDYSFAFVPHSYSYTLTALKTGFIFSPQSTSGTLNATATHNFSGSPCCTVSGIITLNGSPHQGVTVNQGGFLSTTTNSSGAYSFADLPAGSAYSLIPSKLGYTFNPAFKSGTLSSNVTVNFTATMTDSDTDGLGDYDEGNRGTNPQNPDTDGDGVNDGQEVSDGSNPLDAGSYIAKLGATVCSEWNGFLGMSNIVEHVNSSTATIGINSRLYSLAGTQQSQKSFSVKTGNQFDLITSDMGGFKPDTYGKVCASLTKGKAGDLDGRMVYYKPDSAGALQFAFAMPFGNGMKGPLYVQYNTSQRSSASSDTGNLVANWIQVTNLETSTQRGKLRFYSPTGTKISEKSLSIPAGGRQDAAGNIPSSSSGLVEWIPSSATARFQVRNVRYFYDNAGATASFDAAFQYEGRKGSGEVLSVPLDTRSSKSIIEVSNTTAVNISVALNIYAASGSLRKSLTLPVKAHATTSIDVEQYLANAQGIATIDSATLGSALATVTQIAKTSSGKIQNLYALDATQALGSVMKGSYNTFIGQSCHLLLTNPSSATARVALSMKNYTGFEPLKGAQVSVPAHGLVDYNLCSKAAVDLYGIVTVQPEVSNSIVATVVRFGANDIYRFPTPVRE